MKTDAFARIIDLLPEPLFLLSGDGVVLAANQAAAEFTGSHTRELCTRRLEDLVADVPEKVAHYLRVWARNRALMPGSLTWRGRDGQTVACRCGGALLQAADEQETALLLLRCLAKDEALGRFRALNDQIAALSREIAARKRAEEELRQAHEELEQRIRERTAELARTSDACQTAITQRGRIEEEAREHEERFRQAFESAPIGMALVSPDGRWLRVNRALCELVGYSEPELLATDFQSITHPDDLMADLEQARQVLAGEIRSYQREKRYVHQQGRIVWSLLSVSLVRNAEGRPLYFIAQIQDITERKRSLEVLREREELLRQIAENIEEVFFVLAPRGERLFYVSPTYETLWGRTCQSLFEEPRSWLAAVHPEDRARVVEVFRDPPSERETEQEYRIVRPDGSVRHIWARIVPVRNAYGEVYRIVGTAVDVSKRKQGEAERTRLLREREHLADHLRLLLESTGEAVYGIDTEGRCTFINKAAAEMLGWSIAEVVGKNMHEVIHRHPAAGPSSAADQCPLLRTFRSGQSCRIEGELLWRRDGVAFPAAYASYPIVANGVVRGAVVTFSDISERRRAEAALRLRELALEAFNQGVTICDTGQPDNPIVYVNQGFERLTGYRGGEAVGRNCRFLQGPDTDPAAVAAVREAILEERACMVELLNYRKDGTSFWNALSLAPVHDQAGKVTHFVGVQTDVTAIKQLEEQFHQAQKMEAIGHLAGGVAHDFNNLLTVILGFGELLQDELAMGDRARPLVEEIIKAGERAADLTRQLLAFSRKQVLQPRVMDLNDLVAKAQKMLRRLIGEDVRLLTVLAPALWRVRVDPGQIEQVLVNLAVNGRDAMPKGGKLTIETENGEWDEASARSHPEAKPGRYVVLRVSDTGCGMDRETQARIFEPFFTTKGPGKGTGLGLATVYGIVRQSGGFLDVASEPGQGTTFTVYLPTVEGAVPALRPVERPPAPRGKEIVLLVEDEGSVRSLARYALQMNGYTVLEAVHGAEALRMCQEHDGPIDLLLTDVVMPELGGRDLAERLSALYPRLKVLYVSGYTDDAVVRHGVLEAESEFLQKPYSLDVLLQKVRAVLDQSKTAGVA